MKLYPHQRRFLEKKDNDTAILTWETQTGKTFTATLWLEQKNRHRNAVVICPKQIREKWTKEAPEAKVFSFEDFLKAKKLPKNPTAIVVDEADNMASPLFVARQRSKRTEKLYDYVMEHPDAHILLLSATPVRSTPWNMHTLLVLARIVSPASWKKYRATYFELTQKPYLPRPAWLPQSDWRPRMQTLINKYTDVALRQDLVDQLPPETHEILKLNEPNYEKNTEWEPAKQFVEDHRLEQHQKSAVVSRLARGVRKVVVVAHYRRQIDALQEDLSKDRATFVLDGRTKDIHGTIAAAEADPECYFIIQASVGAGFSLPSFSTMIFASQGYSVRNYVQMTGRMKQITKPRALFFYYLQAGRCDRMIYNSIEKGKDFIPSEYLKEVDG